ncbi:ribonuclease H, partial [Trifolium pratense]
MGFRHLYGFNLAMLGKQGWKLLTNHDTILSRVFKAKYYSKEGFLDAKLGHNPSYVWRSIHASQNSQPYITTTMVEGKENMKVSDLTDHNTGIWNREERTIFSTFSILPYLMEVIIDNSHLKVEAQQQRNRDAGVSTVTKIQKWLKPTMGSFKCNVDTTCYVEDNNYCVRACIRDNNNHFVQAFAKKLKGTPSIAEAEAIGVLE